MTRARNSLRSLRLEVVKALKGVSTKHFFLYALVFLFGFLHQPTWVRDNFWLKADFYDSFPFQFPYLLFLFIYSVLSVGATWSVIQMIKKYL